MPKPNDNNIRNEMWNPYGSLNERKKIEFSKNVKS